MSDEYTCNSCGALSNVGYFYCEVCHRLHKKEKHKTLEDDPITQNKCETDNPATSEG